MKVSAINTSAIFKGNDTYRQEIKEKSETTLKLAIGTAIAAAGTLAAYYITRKPKVKPQPVKPENLTPENTETTIRNNRKIIKKYINEPGKKIIEKTIYDKDGKEIKTLKSVLEPIYTVNIPTGWQGTFTITQNGVLKAERVREYTLGMKPKTKSDEKHYNMLQKFGTMPS